MTSSLRFRELVYFGDSLTDRGRVFDLTEELLKVPLPPSSEGYAEQFSNGSVHSEVTPQLLEVGSESYASGGAQAIGSRTVRDFIVSLGRPDILLAPLDRLPADVLDTDIDLSGQVRSFLGDAGGGGVEPGTAAVLFVGLNDYSNIDLTNPPNPVELIGEVVGNITAAALTLAEAGVDEVLLYNLPSPTFFPIEADPHSGRDRTRQGPDRGAQRSA